MKTIQVAYLENVESRKWMQKNIPTQKQSEFIREAVASKIELDKKAIPKRSKK